MDSRKTAALHELAREKHEQRKRTTRRQLIRGAAAAGAGAISLSAATGSVSAQSDVVFPDESDPSLQQIRVERARYKPLSSDPAEGVGDRVVTYVLDGDLP